MIIQDFSLTVVCAMKGPKLPPDPIAKISFAISSRVSQRKVALTCFERVISFRKMGGFSADDDKNIIVKTDQFIKRSL